MQIVRLANSTPNCILTRNVLKHGDVEREEELCIEKVVDLLSRTGLQKNHFNNTLKAAVV